MEPSIKAEARARAQGKAWVEQPPREPTEAEVKREIVGCWIRTLRTKLGATGYAGGDILKVPPHYWLIENE